MSIGIEEFIVFSEQVVYGPPTPLTDEKLTTFPAEDQTNRVALHDTEYHLASWKVQKLALNEFEAGNPDDETKTTSDDSVIVESMISRLIEKRSVINKTLQSARSARQQIFAEEHGPRYSIEIDELARKGTFSYDELAAALKCGMARVMAQFENGALSVEERASLNIMLIHARDRLLEAHPQLV